MRPPLRTYSHLSDQRRRPSAYEIGTTGLLWYPAQGFEVQTPVTAWFARFQTGSPLRCRDWDAFRDPRQMTYAAYVKQRTVGEHALDSVLQSIEARGYDQGLAIAWTRQLERLLPVARFPIHGLHMAAAYLGQLAPSGRLVALAAFQAADELRRVQRLAYRMRQLMEVRPSFGAGSRDAWLGDQAWQPLRALIERLLVTYDWGEAFVALNLAVKPALDALLMDELPRRAIGAGDPLLAELLYILAEDGAWQREWSSALAAMLLAEDEANGELIEAWREPWRREAAEALTPLAAILQGASLP